jgi:YegS/Rv2252/BmrU family lipid kinase
MQYHFIYNPTANRGNAKKTWSIIEEYLKQQKVSYTLHETQYIDHARIITQELTKSLQQPLCVVSVGGDGTLSEIVNGIVDFENTYLSIIPCGSGNDFVTATNIPRKDPIETIKFILAGKSRKINYIMANEIRAINVVGFGIDTDVLEDYYKRKHFSADFRYKISTFKCALFIKMHDSEISVDDGPFEKVKTAMLTIGNGQNIGGGICVCPEAKINDDILDFTLVNSFPK